MALPPNASTGVVTGTFVDGAGNPLAGIVTFTPSTAVLDASGKTIIAPAALTTTLDANGSFTITLVATDDPDLNPTGWTWGVRFSFAAASITAFSFAVPSGGTVDLSAVSPVPSSPGNAITKGDPGGWVTEAMTGSADLNTITTPGTYFVSTASASDPTKNAPAAIGGHLEVVGYSSYQLQRYTAYNSWHGTTQVWWRVSPSSGTWTTWAAISVQGTPGGSDLTGSGSPVGVVTPASAGIYYTDTTGAGGAWRWLSTGTTSSSWMVALGDTGWLDLSPYLQNGACKGGGNAPPGGAEQVRARRIGAVVEYQLSIAIPAWVSGQTALVIPSGLRPDSPSTLYMPNGYSSTPGATIAAGNVNIYTTAASSGLRYQWTVTTADPWPVTLP